MKDLMTFINSKTSNAFTNVKLVGVVYDKETSSSCFRFIYKDRNFTMSDKEQLLSLVKQFYNNSINAQVKVKRDYIDEEVVTDYVYKYIISNHTSIKNDITRNNISVTLGQNDVNIVVNVYDAIYDFFVSKDFVQELKNYLQSMSFCTFNISLNKVSSGNVFTKALNKNEQEAIEAIASQLFDSKPTNFKVTNIVNIIGADLNDNALDVGSIKGAMQKVQIAGKIRFFTVRSFVSKRKDASGNFIEKNYYSWSLYYGSNSLQCVYFPTQGDIEKISSIVEDMTVILGGDVEEYNGRINFKVKSISSCTLPEIKEEEVEAREVNANYLYVKPEPYITETQFNFFDIPKEPNEFLKCNDVVVFDVETTGLDYKECEIIEIGAVKLHEGEITEKFSCFVKPTKSIPEEITNLTGITNDMVKSAYPINKVIVDFYKFCYGCVLVAYNIDFDYKFINSAGTKVGYKFNNRQVDALFLARRNVAGAKNFTLKAIATKLGVSLDGAHRAINDATATAEVLKLISDNVSPN